MKERTANLLESSNNYRGKVKSVQREKGSSLETYQDMLSKVNQELELTLDWNTLLTN